MAQPDVSEIQKFEASLLHEFENRKCLLVRYTETGFIVSGGEPPYAQFSIVSRDMLELFKKGTPISEIAAMALKGAAPPPQAPQQANANLIAVVRDGRFLSETIEAIKKKKGLQALPRDEPELPVAYQFAQGKSYYILCGVDTGAGYSFVTQEKFGSYGMDDGQMRRLILENLYMRLVGMIKDGTVKQAKVAEGVFAVRIPGGLAPAFLVISNVFFDYMKQVMGIQSVEAIYAYPITTEDILFIDPRAVADSMNAAKQYMVQCQEDGKKNNNLVYLEPLIITKTRISFLMDEMAKARPPEKP
ncbi:MAG TPA: hypothetical protein VLD37_00085, partial [Candidatus Bilamarchaeum sp.]|nr:hypothetical protein [Candidatus Bilamarchaeum sp.]